MHISEGVLPGWLLVSGYALTSVGVALGLKKLDYSKIPIAGVLSAVFFVASLIHVPIGVGSAHLILNGVAGLILGWAVFPVILVGLFLQAVLFQFGGLTVLGVNTFNIAFPAVIAYYLCQPLLRETTLFRLVLVSIIAVTISILGSGILLSLELLATAESFKETAKLIILVHFPIVIVESIITFFILSFLNKVAPELLKINAKQV